MLTDLKELEKFFKLCRKNGIVDISFEGITVKFGDPPAPKTAASSEEVDESQISEPTPEELMYYAVREMGPA